MLLPSSLRLAVSCWGSMPDDIREPEMESVACYRKNKKQKRNHTPADVDGRVLRARDVAARLRLKSGGKAARRVVERSFGIGIGDGELGLRAWRGAVRHARPERGR